MSDITAPGKFKLGHLGTLNQVTQGLAKTIRAMADGTLDSQVGGRICHGLGILRACFETQQRLASPGMGEPPRPKKIVWEFVHVSEPRPIDEEEPLLIEWHDVT